MITIGSRSLYGERSQGRPVFLLAGSGYGDTIQMRHSMPQQAAKADSSYSHVGPPIERIAYFFEKVRASFCW